MFHRPEAARLLERILGHHAAKTTELMPTTWRVDARRYVDPEFLAPEQTKMLRRRPLAICPVAMVKETGDYYAQNLVGVAVLCLNAGPEGIKVFVNRCRHRGAPVVTSERGQAGPRLTCRFHAWSYDLAGKLVHCPKPAEAELGCDHARLGLRELPSLVRAGVVWAVLDDDAEAPAGLQQLGEFARELDVLGLDRHTLYRHERHVWPFNWKFGVDAALETYHFDSAHPGVAKVFLSSLAIFDRVGDNARMIFPKKTIRTDQEPDRILEHIHLNYFVFPASFLLKVKDHVFVFRYLPLSTASCAVEWFMLIADPPESEAREQHWQANAAIFADVASQDAAISEVIQAGLYPGTAEQFTLTRIEPGVREFHRSIDACLAS